LRERERERERERAPNARSSSFSLQRTTESIATHQNEKSIYQNYVNYMLSLKFLNYTFVELLSLKPSIPFSD
jgi:hypothetical protein